MVGYYLDGRMPDQFHYFTRTGGTLKNDDLLWWDLAYLLETESDPSYQVS